MLLVLPCFLKCLSVRQKSSVYPVTSQSNRIVLQIPLSLLIFTWPLFAVDFYLVFRSIGFCYSRCLFVGISQKMRSLTLGSIPLTELTQPSTGSHTCQPFFELLIHPRSLMVALSWLSIMAMRAVNMGDSPVSCDLKILMRTSST